MRRFYTCPIIGSGTEENPYRPAIADDGIEWAAEIPTDRNGKPIAARCVVMADEKDDAVVMKRVTVERAADLQSARTAVEVTVSGDVRI